MTVHAAVRACAPRDNRRLLEMLALYMLPPGFILAGFVPTGYHILILCLLALAIALVLLVNRNDCDAWGLGRRGRDNLTPCLVRGLVVGAPLLLLVIGINLIVGRGAFPMLENRPGMLASIALVYPLSVVAQEILFRGFFFWRYEHVLPRGMLIAANALLFGWVHIIYGTWVSVALSAIGGLAFAEIYLRHRSLVGLCILHFLAGMAVFATGYGQCFFLPE